MKWYKRWGWNLALAVCIQWFRAQLVKDLFEICSQFSLILIIRAEKKALRCRTTVSAKTFEIKSAKIVPLLQVKVIQSPTHTSIKQDLPRRRSSSRWRRSCSSRLRRNRTPPSCWRRRSTRRPRRTGRPCTRARASGASRRRTRRRDRCPDRHRHLRLLHFSMVIGHLMQWYK